MTTATPAAEEIRRCRWPGAGGVHGRKRWPRSGRALAAKVSAIRADTRRTHGCQRRQRPLRPTLDVPPGKGRPQLASSLIDRIRGEIETAPQAGETAERVLRVARDRMKSTKSSTSCCLSAGKSLSLSAMRSGVLKANTSTSIGQSIALPETREPPRLVPDRCGRRLELRPAPGTLPGVPGAGPIRPAPAWRRGAIGGNGNATR